MTIMYVYYDYHMHRHTNHTNYNMRKIIPRLSNLTNQIVHAIGGLINLLSTRLIRYQPRQVFYVFHVVFTYRANIIDTFTHLHVIHVSHYMYTCTWYKSVTQPRCRSVNHVATYTSVRNLYMYTDQYHGWYVVSLKHIYILIKI